MRRARRVVALLSLMPVVLGACAKPAVPPSDGQPPAAASPDPWSGPGSAPAASASAGPLRVSPPAEGDPQAFEEAVCPTRHSDVARADALLEGIYHWTPHDPVELGLDLDLAWDEDPFEEPNWRFQFHALRWVWALTGADAVTDDPRYLDRALEVVKDWAHRNPVDAPAAPVAWDDHAAAWRAKVLTCLALRVTDLPSWLADALAVHVTMLADPDFYVEDKGNHALNQDIGLLAIACVTGDQRHQQLAVDRIERLVIDGVDDQGVMNEQAVEYQDYNLDRYRAAIELIEACGVARPRTLDRIDRMPEVLAHMTLPDGTYLPLGDTDRRAARALDDPAMLFVTSGGDRGSPPKDTLAVYDAGFVLARSGWGQDRPLAQEHMISLRFGPRPMLHGHDDHGSLTLYAQGQPLLVDPGKYRYASVEERFHVMSRDAHNVLSIPGCEPRDLPSRVQDVVGDAAADHITVVVPLCPGVAWTRTVVFLRDGGEVVVVDRVRGSAPAAASQRWQLEVNGEVTQIGPQAATVRWPSGASLILEQLEPVAEASWAAGQRDPLRGWVSLAYGELSPAPHLEFVAAPRTSRLITVLRPGGDEARSSELRQSTEGLRIVVPLAAGGEYELDVTDH